MRAPLPSQDLKGRLGTPDARAQLDMAHALLPDLVPQVLGSRVARQVRLFA